MARFRKRVSAPGDYLTPDGLAAVPSARISHWHETIKQMVSLGIKIPLSWGHLKSATPHDDDDETYWASRAVAGKVTGSAIDPATGELIVEGDAPGVEITPSGALVAWSEGPDGSRVQTSIEEVSVGAMDWTDGKGRLWKDAPVHVAVTPLPVWVPQGGQPGFEPAGPAVQRFGFGNLLTRFGGPPMADDDNKEKKDKGGGDKESGAGGIDMKKVLKKLSESGITLPDDTTESNLLERLWVACTAVSGETGGGGGGEPPPPPAPAEGAGAAMMSTLRANPLSAFLLAEVEKTQKERRLDRIAALEKRGLPYHRGKALRAEATTLRFALTPGGQPTAHAIDRELDGLESALPPDGYPLTRQITPADVREAVPPEGQNNTVAAARKLADTQARNGHLPARK